MGARNVLVALAPIHSMEMPPPQAQLSGGWTRVAGGTPGNQASAALCCPLGAGSSSPEAGNGQAERNSCGLMLEHLGIMLIPLLQIKFHPTASFQVSSGVLLGAETGLCHLSLLYTETTPASRPSSSWLLSLRAMDALKVNWR